VPRLPVRSKRDDGRFPSREIVLYEGQHGRAPRAPAWLSKRAQTRFKAAWRTPVSATWRAEDALVVARWAALATWVEAGDERSWVWSQLASAEDRLGLTPRSRAARRIRIEPAAPEPPRNGGLDSETRAELERQLAELAEERSR
jgi:hypothetical protein